jgi:hypothetical protein
MLDAFTKHNDPHQVLELSADSYLLTVDEEIQPRAKAHQRGVPSRNIPARPIVPATLPKNFINDLRRIVMSYIVTGAA